MLEQQFIQFKDYSRNLYTGENPLTIEASESNYNYKVLASDLQNGQQYTFFVGDSVRDAGITLKYTVLLYDFTANKTAESHNLVIAEQNKEFVIDVPSTGTWSLLIYAGLQGSTAGVGMTFEDIMVTKKQVPTQGGMALPYCDKIGLAFSYESNDTPQVALVRPNGDFVKRLTNGHQHTEEGIFVIDSLPDLSDSLAPNECFRLRMRTYDMISYSNMLCYMVDDDDYLSSLQYYCNEPQFGFPFGEYVISRFVTRQNIVKVALPIHLSAAQYKQTDKIYETRTGEQIVLYANINKEYEGETDYIPEEWHEKIVTALSCDEVYINDERVTKSDSYEIDHDNYTYSDCGIRLTRATFKVKTNVIQRNSNC